MKPAEGPRGPTTADVVRVVGLELRLAWTVAAKDRPRTSAFHGELFRVAALVAELSVDFDWDILVSDGFDTRAIGPAHWRVLAGIRIEPGVYCGAEVAKAKDVLVSVVALL